VAVCDATLTGAHGMRLKFPKELEFDEGKATLKANSKTSDKILQCLSDFLKQNTSVTKFRIEGHTDNKGSADLNLKLSQERADAVITWLTAHGTDAGRLTSKGYGATKPLVKNDTPEHLAMNRRCEFHVQEIAGNTAEGP
jgi:outer membrane protein OmpA-like peptidoglycan-associated protein